MQSVWKFISDVMMLNFTYHRDRGFVTFKEIKIFSYCHAEGGDLERALEKSTRIVAEISEYFEDNIKINMKFFAAEKKQLLDLETWFYLKSGKHVGGFSMGFPGRD